MGAIYFFLSGCLLSFSVASLCATTIHVPADSSTIQAGIDGANEGDTVLVAAGTYYETINFQGKGIVVRSEGGPLNTIISGEFNTLDANGVNFTSGEDSASIFERFTVKKGSESGIFCQNASLTCPWFSYRFETHTAI